MVKFYESSFSYDYSFSAVALAYFLRYPNPYSTHVLTTDVIERNYDPEQQRLHTVRLHLKRSKIPAAVLKILPKGLLGASANGDSQSYILETSTVDVKEGWMKTESKNMELTGILSVVERQTYLRARSADLSRESPLRSGTFGSKAAQNQSHPAQSADGRTDVETSVTLLSQLGQGRWRSRMSRNAEDRGSSGQDDGNERPPKAGFFKSWSTTSLQRSIELIGLRRARTSQPNAKEGMKVVLERLRQGGLVGVLEGMRQDREMMLGGHSPARLMRSRIGKADPVSTSSTSSTDVDH